MPFFFHWHAMNAKSSIKHNFFIHLFNQSSNFLFRDQFISDSVNTFTCHRLRVNISVHRNKKKNWSISTLKYAWLSKSATKSDRACSSSITAYFHFYHCNFNVDGRKWWIPSFALLCFVFFPFDGAVMIFFF